MKTTARNQFAGTVTEVEVGPVSAQVTLALAACGDVSTPGGCTLIGCTDQLNVELGAIGDKFASSLPITLSICIDDKGCEAFVVEAVGGAKGGGRPDMAQGGGPDGAKANDAIAAVKAALAS